MKYVLTGATGFLGANLLYYLQALGHDVHCIIRKPNALVENKGATLHTIPLTENHADVEKLARVMDGADGVFHLAGIFDPSPGGRDRMTQVHVFGTRALLRAAEMAGVRRFLTCSSSITVGFGGLDSLGTERSSVNSEQMVGRTGALRWYFDTKKQAEILTLGWESLETVVVNPDYILGAFDIKPTSGQMIVTMAKLGVPFYPLGGKCFLGAEDCVKAHVAAMTKGRSGQRYLLGYHNHSYQEILEKIATVVGRKAPRLPMPTRAMKLAGRVGQLASRVDEHRFAGLEPMVLLSMQENRYRSGQKMVDELGIQPKPIEESIELAYIWFRENGYC